MTADKAFISEPIGPKHSAGTRHKTLLDAASISNSLASRVTAIGWRSAIKSLVSFDGLNADDARYRLGQDQQSGDCKMALIIGVRLQLHRTFTLKSPLVDRMHGGS